MKTKQIILVLLLSAAPVFGQEGPNLLIRGLKPMHRGSSFQAAGMCLIYYQTPLLLLFKPLATVGLAVFLLTYSSSGILTFCCHKPSQFLSRDSMKFVYGIVMVGTRNYLYLVWLVRGLGAMHLSTLGRTKGHGEK
jgi:hypothetical protein